MTLVRPALSTDAARIGHLLGQLGYITELALVQQKLAALAVNSMDAVLVAEVDGQVVGVASLHVFDLFHEAGRLGRITSFVVDRVSRGAGIGTVLLKAADEFFQGIGCVRAEVTSGNHREGAHAFYESHGYQADERRFLKRFDQQVIPVDHLRRPLNSDVRPTSERGREES